ncbi:hypothetical protein OROMI_023451 [Orobanche minor]
MNSKKKLEDVLESQVSDQILSQFDRCRDEDGLLMVSLDSEEMHQEIKSFAEMVEIVKNYSGEISFLEDEEDGYAAAEVADSSAKKSEMVGLFDERRRIKSSLTNWMTDQLCVASLEGMSGIGKTILAKEAFKDQFVCQYFDIRVWINVGKKYQLNRIIRSILAQIGSNVDGNLGEGYEVLIEYLKECLKGKRYLIVLDDVWSIEIRDFVNKVLPEEINGSRVMLTTRLHEIATWDLLRQKLFGEEWCPPILEKVGKKIAAICEGLPLAIVVVAGILSKAEKTMEYWNEVAEKKNSIFRDAYDEMSEVLYPSYRQLPEYLKLCFLYMGIFPENYQISISKLYKLWVVEGFLRISQAKINEIQTVEWLEELVSRSIIIISQRGSNYIYKTCKLHSAV